MASVYPSPGGASAGVMAEEYLASFRHIHQLIDQCLRVTEGQLLPTPGIAEEESLEKWQALSGHKETPVSVLVKLAGLLLKIMPAEKALQEEITPPAEKSALPLSEEDIAVINLFAERMRRQERVDKINQEREDSLPLTLERAENLPDVPAPPETPDTAMAGMASFLEARPPVPGQLHGPPVQRKECVTKEIKPPG